MYTEEWMRDGKREGGLEADTNLSIIVRLGKI